MGSPDGAGVLPFANATGEPFKAAKPRDRDFRIARGLQ